MLNRLVVVFVSVLAAVAAVLPFAAPAYAQTDAQGGAALRSQDHRSDLDHGADLAPITAIMVYDTLFALDDKLEVKPQMVDKWTVSPDKLTWTFTLRDGLEWPTAIRN